MHNYEQSIHRFKAIRDKFIHNEVLESDLPFLFHKKGNKVGILMLHGSEASPCNTYQLGQMLADKGYTTIGGLLEGHGHDTQRLHSGIVSWRDCYKSAVEYLDILSDMVEEIYVLGSSFGGCIAYLLGIEYSKNVSGVIAVSAPTFSKYEPDNGMPWLKQVIGSIKAVEHNIHHLSIPTLILHGSDDRVVKVNQAFFAYDRINTQHKKMVIYNNIGHSLGFGFNNDEVLNDIDNFIKNYNTLSDVMFVLDGFEDAKTVHLAGEFNNWNGKELEMYPHEGKWLFSLKLRKGQYHYKFVINGSNWILNPNAPEAYTPYGQKNSLVIVS